MSQDSRADQIAFHLYTKLFSVVSQARTTSEPRSQPKVDRWFNLETPESELFSKDAKEPYKSVSQNPPPPLEIQVLLAVPDLAHTNQGLVLRLPDSSRTRIHPPPPHILLESYTMTFTAGPDPADVPLPTIYKAGIPLFRSLYTLLRLLPAWKLHKRLRRRAGVGPSLAIVLRVGAESSLGFGVDGVPPLETQTHAFTEVPHPMGMFVLSVRYLSSPTFQLDELESLLSSRFMSQDERPFMPTLARRADPSPPHPVPQTTALADRFLLPSAGSSPGRGIPLPLPPDRQLASGSLPRRQLSLSRPSTGTGQHRPSPSYDLSHRPSPSNLEATRTMLRQESAHHRTSSASSSLSPTNSFFTPTVPPSNLTLNTNIPPSSSSSSSIPPSTTATTATPITAMQGQGQTPPRRPVFPFPFKSNTLASSSISAGGLGSQPSSLNDRVSLHDRMAGLSERRSVDLAFTPATSASPIPHAQTTANTPVAAPGSSEDQSGVPTTTPPTRKRYSSSFGHRYVSGGLPGSAGSAGSGVSGGPGSLGTGTGAGAGGSTTGSAQAGEGSSLSRSGSRSGRPPHQISGLGIQVPAGRMSPQLAEFPRPRNLSMDPQRSPTRTNSFLAGHTDDDDISVFVQSIDMRKPLVGRGKEREDRQRRGEEERERERTGRWGEGGAKERNDDEQGERPRGRDSHSRVGRGVVGSPPLAPARTALDPTRGMVASPPRMRTALSSPPTSPPAPMPVSPRQRMGTGSPRTMATSPQGVGSPPAGLMLTSEREVDERLRRMNEAFIKSLEGLGGGTSRAGQSGSTSGEGEGGSGSRSRSGSGSGSGNNEEMSGERETTIGRRGFGHFRNASGGDYRLGAETSSMAGRGGSGAGRSESPFTSTRGDGPRRDAGASHAYSAPRTDRAPLGAPLASTRRENSPFSGGAYPSIFARPRSAASRDRSEEVIGRLEFDYEGVSGGGGGGGDGRSRDGTERRERSGRY
ncbi:autophagy-related protein 13-domain-containing protein [Collybia nuda]|uniref:Autophagy-related protein 13 n=1 Tax=Collybia nuda TaxID=64659 RepID=A0A9P5YCQ5_9AGAR|nr:autophagy-related protein 13-domain-containing protein [Collybia nuda]